MRGLLLVLLLTGCATTPLPKPATAGASFLYEVRRDGSDARVFVYGAADYARDTNRQLDRAVAAVVDRADRIALPTLEVGENREVGRAFVAERGSLPDGTLADVLSEADVLALQSVGWQCGWSSVAESNAKPWWAAIRLYLGCFDDRGVQGWHRYSLLEDRARLRERPPELVATETLQVDLESLDGPEGGVRFLRETLEHLTSGRLEGVAEAWRAGDERTVISLSDAFTKASKRTLGAQHDVLYARIEREVFDRIDRWLQGDGVLLVGADATKVLRTGGLLSRLRASGATVRSVPRLGPGAPVPPWHAPHQRPPPHRVDLGPDVQEWIDGGWADGAEERTFHRAVQIRDGFGLVLTWSDFAERSPPAPGMLETFASILIASERVRPGAPQTIDLGGLEAVRVEAVGDVHAISVAAWTDGWVLTILAVDNLPERGGSDELRALVDAVVGSFELGE